MLLRTPSGLHRSLSTCAPLFVQTCPLPHFHPAQAISPFIVPLYLYSGSPWALLPTVTHDHVLVQRACRVCTLRVREGKLRIWCLVTQHLSPLLLEVGIVATSISKQLSSLQKVVAELLSPWSWAFSVHKALALW